MCMSFDSLANTRSDSEIPVDIMDLELHINIWNFGAAAGRPGAEEFSKREDEMSQTATGILRIEHQAILRVLGVAEEVSKRIDGGESVGATSLQEILEFLKVFADACHHGKEEDLLFPALERKGMPREGGPVGVMLIEHEQGRALIREMSEAAANLASGNSAAARRWAAAAREYIALLRNHIVKEDNILFVMAERALTDAEQAQLLEEFEKVETRKMGPGTHERMHALMEKLCAEFGVAADPPAAIGHGCGCR